MNVDKIHQWDQQVLVCLSTHFPREIILFILSRFITYEDYATSFCLDKLSLFHIDAFRSNTLVRSDAIVTRRRHMVLFHRRFGSVDEAGSLLIKTMWVSTSSKPVRCKNRQRRCTSAMFLFHPYLEHTIVLTTTHGIFSLNYKTGNMVSHIFENDVNYATPILSSADEKSAYEFVLHQGVDTEAFAKISLIQNEKVPFLVSAVGESERYLLRTGHSLMGSQFPFHV